MAKKRRWRSRARASPALRRALETLGANVRRRREGLGLSREACAELAHIDAKHLYVLEAGGANVTMATLVSLARALGVTLAKLTQDV